MQSLFIVILSILLAFQTNTYSLTQFRASEKSFASSTGKHTYQRASDESNSNIELSTQEPEEDLLPLYILGTLSLSITGSVLAIAIYKKIKQNEAEESIRQQEEEQEKQKNQQLIKSIKEENEKKTKQLIEDIAKYNHLHDIKNNIKQKQLIEALKKRELLIQKEQERKEAVKQKLQVKQELEKLKRDMQEKLDKSNMQIQIDNANKKYIKQNKKYKELEKKLKNLKKSEKKLNTEEIQSAPKIEKLEKPEELAKPEKPKAFSMADIQNTLGLKQTLAPTAQHTAQPAAPPQTMQHLDDDPEPEPQRTFGDPKDEAKRQALSEYDPFDEDVIAEYQQSRELLFDGGPAEFLKIKKVAVMRDKAELANALKHAAANPDSQQYQGAVADAEHNLILSQRNLKIAEKQAQEYEKLPKKMRGNKEAFDETSDKNIVGINNINEWVFGKGFWKKKPLIDPLTGMATPLSKRSKWLRLFKYRDTKMTHNPFKG